MPATGAQNLGNAQGKITIDTSDLARIQATTQQVGQTVARNLGQIDKGAKQAQQGIGGLATSLQSMGGVLGLATGAGLVVQLGRMALQADALATAYRRQSVAALSLAGSQAKLNDLLDTYQQVTGGAIDKATAMADVTRLQAVGFADTAKELETFVTAARGISVAMGSSIDYVTGQLQLAIANQSTMRLDQIGLGVEEVTKKIKELRAADSTLTEAQAYQNAILGIATQKYGALAKSVEAQATGAEKAAKAWKELQLQIGDSLGPAVGGIMEGLANELDGIAQKFRDIARDAERAKSAMAGMGMATGKPSWLTADPVGDWLRGHDIGLGGITDRPWRDSPGVSSGGSIGQPPIRNNIPSYAAPRFNGDQTDAIRQWSMDVQQIEREAGNARLDATRQYEQQRTQTIADYGRTIAREEEDFARNRARSIREYNRQIAEAQEDAAKREAESARRYAKAVASVQEDAANREAKWLEDYNERVAELRQDSNERLVDLEAKYSRDRERAAADHRDRLSDAAGRLDAVAVANEQRAYARQEQEAAENYNEQRQNLVESLAEQLADAQEAYQERLADAREADADRLADMKEAQDEQLQAAREADAERLADMKRSFEERIAQEDEERAIANQRRAEDHAVQMAQMEAAQAERMAQIDRQEAEQKTALEEAFLKQLESLGIHNKNWLELQDLRQRESLKLFDAWLKEIEKSLIAQLPPIQGPAEQRITSFASFDATRRGLANESLFAPMQSAASGGSVSNRSITIAEGAIVVNAAPNHDERTVARQVRTEMERLLMEAAR